MSSKRIFLSNFFLKFCNFNVNIKDFIRKSSNNREYCIETELLHARLTKLEAFHRLEKLGKHTNGSMEEL